MQEEFGAAYINKLRDAYPELPGRADFCVYWFYKAHRHLKKDCYAGLVGTNTITQNYSREGSLDYIVNNGGEIFNAYSSMNWSGEAAVFVSIACWKKGKFDTEKILYTYIDGELQKNNADEINSSLSLNIDLTGSIVLECNKKPKRVFQGQTHGHEGFLLETNVAKKIIKENKRYFEVLKPYLNGEEMVSNINCQPSRFVIDFTFKDILEASTFDKVFSNISKTVLQERQTKAIEQKSENEKLILQNPKAKVNKHHINFYNKWWKLSYGREDLMNNMKEVHRYIACSQTLLRPIFEFISTEISPSQSLYYFGFEDYYSFGIIQSIFHWEWVKARGATLGDTYRYNSSFVWDTFPWPQTPTETQIKKVAATAKALHTARTQAMQAHNMSLRDLYRLLEQPGTNTIRFTFCFR